ncbi:MAG: hypothetical protein GXO36_02785 [Chloroflexi bacterium]|nr:hypothetical protein [Chloroflexota bacterium]
MNEALTWLAQMDWTSLVLLIVGIIALWIVIKFLFQLAIKVFTCGCMAILLVVMVVVIWRFLVR